MRRLGLGTVVVMALAFGLVSFLAISSAQAYTRYNDGCQTCHGAFTDGVSPQGTAFPNNNKHTMHRSNSYMAADCGLCHRSDDSNNPFIGSSDGTADNPGLGCVGCHGRAEDAGNDSISAGLGAGLRQHHDNENVTTCLLCHSDSSSANYTPVGEDVFPTYYGTVDADADDPCNPLAQQGNENWSDDTAYIGLDNDGDLDYDGDDPDCAVVECGNGIIEPGEDCDDGNVLDGDCCSASCQFEPQGSACEDGEFCNGEETCDGAGSCQVGTPVECSDGVGCTDDFCDEVNDVCVNDVNDMNCPDDGLFCTGLEFCDPVIDCTSAGDPCPGGTVCNEGSDVCEAEAACGNGIPEPGEACDDGNLLDGDCCSASCQFEPAGSSCEDGEFCNGEETCDGAGTCLVGNPVDCDDGVGCTVDACDEAADACDNAPDDGLCSDGAFCNGVEACDPVNDCQPGLAVDCSDGVGCTDDACDEANGVCVNDPNDGNCPDDGAFCNGLEFCDAANDCSSAGDPCPGGTVCNEGGDSCDVAPGCGDGFVDPGEECDDGNTVGGDCCSASCEFEPAGSACEDGEFCNGEETCDGAGVCLDGNPVDCEDGIACTSDACDEVGDVCESIAQDNLCADDGLFCSGQEVCDLFQGCISTGDPCGSGEVCDEAADTCNATGGKATLCHFSSGKKGTKPPRTLRVGARAVDAHLAHGDLLGPCPDAVSGRTTLCHFSSGKKRAKAPRTKRVRSKAVAKHLAHGDVLGPCSE